MRTKLIRPTASEDEGSRARSRPIPTRRRTFPKPVAGIIRRHGRPPKPDRKVSVTLRLDRDVVDRFKATGAGWQTRINAALRKSRAV